MRATTCLAASLSAALLSLAAAPAGAQTPAPPPTIDACYVPMSGTIYRINTTASPAPGAPANCLSATHVRFTWNQQGPKGDKGDKGDTGAAGAAGATGATGPRGPEGPAATSRYQRTSGTVTISSGQYAAFSVICGGGRRAVSGGIDIAALTGAEITGVRAIESFPLADDRWRFGVINQLTHPVDVTLYAVCL